MIRTTGRGKWRWGNVIVRNTQEKEEGYYGEGCNEVMG